jgi:glycosyltransferase involved in cell wall biosynthesis
LKFTKVTFKIGELMKNNVEENIFLVWTSFQRRAKSLGNILGLNVKYIHYKWEEKNRILKSFSYIIKAVISLMILIKTKPKFIFIQLAPTPLLYIVSAYCAITKSKYIADCHNTMIYDSHWIKWPFAKPLLSRSIIMIVHNQDVLAHANSIGLRAVVVQDPLPKIDVTENIEIIRGIHIYKDSYVIVPCSMAEDEPIEDVFDAARKVSNTLFVFTWYSEKISKRIIEKAPENICFSGYLEEPEFNLLYSKANAALVLTTREGTQPSGAAEAISLGIPLVISDIETTRHFYKDAPVYVRNDSDSIAEGVRNALGNNAKITEKIKLLRLQIKNDSLRQLHQIEKLMKLG